MASLTTSSKYNAASLRRKFLRFFDPKWRQRTHSTLHDSSVETHTHPAFHHSQLQLQQTRNQLLGFPRRDNTHNDRIDNNKIYNRRTLDNFYTRPHIPSSQKVPFLIVGGSDGSGTRYFVSTLLQLGVTMIVDDYSTKDIHGEEMVLTDPRDATGKKQRHGWPPLVQMVLNATHSANYSIHDLPRNVQEASIEALLKLKSSLLKKGKQARKKDYLQQQHAAAGVQYGWKAPISMVLLPLLQHVFGPIKYIHVVRDGRDVALSDNQSPSQKFYNTFYDGQPQDNNNDVNKDDTKKNTNTDQDHAMQLWNAWNHQVHQWAQNQQSEQEEQQQLVDNNINDGNIIKSFDYMTMRTEDLIHPETRFEALVQLAEFVGARVTREQLYCMSQKPLHDLGQSGLREGGPSEFLAAAKPGETDTGTPKDEQRVIARYGKWKLLLQNAPQIPARLQEIGALSLRAFGYEPPRRFLDESSDVKAFSDSFEGRHC